MFIFYKWRLFVFILFAVILQYSLLAFQPSLLFHPDILIIILCAVVLRTDSRTALFAGITAGAVSGALSSVIFSVYLMTYGFMGWFVNRLGRSIDKEMWHTRILFVFVALLVKWLHLCFFCALFYKTDILHILVSLRYKMPVQIFMTVAVSVPVFFIFDRFMVRKKSYRSLRW